MSTYSWPEGMARDLEQYTVGPERRRRVDVAFYDRVETMVGHYNQYGVDYDPNEPGSKEEMLQLLSDNVAAALKRCKNGVHWVRLTLPVEVVKSAEYL